MDQNKIQKNDVFTSRIIDISSEGVGVAKLDDFTVFVPFTCLGELVEIKVLKVMPRYAFGKIERIVEASEDRIDPDCKVYDKCGGCSLRHMTYQKEVEIKENYVYETLKRSGSQSLEGVDARTIIASKDDYGYRNKAQYPIRKDASGKVLIGFYAKRSHTVVDSSECRLQPAFFEVIVNITREFLEQNSVPVYDEVSHKGLVRHLYIRHAEVTNQTMVCLVINGRAVPEIDLFVAALKEQVPSLVSVILNVNREKTNVILGRKCINVFGSDTIEDELSGLRFSLSPLSFYQVNRSSAELLLGVVKEFAALKKTDVLLDLYCGAGAIGLSMASDVSELIGVEIIEDAVLNARENAERNGISNASFICDDASGAAKQLVEQEKHTDIVVLDPPRKGLSEDVIRCVGEMNPSRVVIVSCNVVTLARDIKIFSELGYELKKVQPVDMFPRTNHVECVVLMSRIEK